VGEKTFSPAKQQKHLQSTPLAEPVRTVYVLAMYAHFFAVFGWSQKKRLSSRRAVLPIAKCSQSQQALLLDN
jgi:hypothetical protein